MPARPALAELTIAEDPNVWERLGFAIANGVALAGGVALRFAGEGGGISGWSLRDVALADGELDGLPTRVIGGAARPQPPVAHPNGALAVDHVVVMTPAFDRTAAALDAAGLPLRRVRSAGGPARPFRQGFRRLGPAILELVEQPDGEPGPARFWGLVVVVAELEALAGQLGELIGKPRAAVQPGRRIATVRSREAGIDTALAFMTPETEG